MKSRAVQICSWAVAAGIIFLAGRVSSGMFQSAPFAVPSVHAPAGRTTIGAPDYGPATGPRLQSHRRATVVPAARPARASSRPAASPALAARPVPAPSPERGRRPISPEPTTAKAQPVFVPVADATCSGCRVTQSADGALQAEIPGTAAGQDSAYALMDFGGSSGVDGPSWVNDRIGLGAGQVPGADLQVLQVTDGANRVVYRVVVAAGSRLLHVESPPGALSVDSIDVNTGAVVPNDGKSIDVSVEAEAGNLLVVSVDGHEVARRTDLHNDSTGPQRYLGAGIVAAASGPTTTTPLSVSHSALTVATKPATPSNPPPHTATLAATPPVTVLAPSASAPPAIVGTPVEGLTLTAASGTWSDAAAAFSVAWQRCDTAGRCATVASGTSFVPQADDVGSALRIAVTATNAAGSGTGYSTLTAPVAAAPRTPAPAAQTAPTISGAAAVGATLTADPGTWTDADTFTFAWQRCDATGACTPVDGTSDATLALTDADAGATIAVVVTASGPGGTTTVSSSSTAVVVAAPVSTAAPTISGDAVVDGTLTASPGAWSDPAASLSYSWQRCDATGACTTIDGATSATLTLTSDDAGATIAVTVTAANAAGSTSATSAGVTVAQPTPAPEPPPAPEPAPTPPTSEPTPEPQPAPAAPDADGVTAGADGGTDRPAPASPATTSDLSTPGSTAGDGGTPSP
jgi:hypothetical protein